jgi:hypothetical protein
MFEVYYWVTLALKTGHDKPTLVASLKATKHHLLVKPTQTTEERISKLKRRISQLSLTDSFDLSRVVACEDKLSDLTSTLTASSKNLIQQSLASVYDCFEDMNSRLKRDDLKFDTKVLKKLVLLSRDTLRHISKDSCSRDELLLELKRSIQEYLGLIMHQVLKAGVTAKDVQNYRKSRVNEAVETEAVAVFN